MKKRVLLAFPTTWDALQLARLPPEVGERYEVLPAEPGDEDVRWDLDVGAWVAETARAWRGRIDGVFSSSDYPGAVAAAALAETLGLPGPSPASVVRAAHKHTSRLLQRDAIPEAVPRFRLFDPADEASWPPDAEFPCFVKPVKGSFSLFARRIEDRAALRAFAGGQALREYQDYYVRPFDGLIERFVPTAPGARHFLAEELLGGEQVTVEGWVDDARAHVLGIVDSRFHPGTRSFASFDYPSHLSPAVQARLGRVACTAVEAIGLAHTLFNVELFHDPVRDRIGLIEVNPRLCGQFADLYAKVDGLGGYEVALALATGDPVPRRRQRGTSAAAASVPLRCFRPVRVARAPQIDELRALEARHPGLLAWSEVHAGDALAVGPETEDGESVRYAVVNLGGESRTDIQAKLADIERELDFALVPMPAPPRALEVR